MKRQGLLLPLLALALLVGCGRKTMPVPPQTMLPRPITDLRFQLDAQGVTLLWSAPKAHENGTPIREIPGYEVARAVVPTGDYCEGCPVPFGPPVRIAADPEALESPTGTEQYTETLLRPHHRYFFKIRTLAGWGLASTYSNVVSFFWDTPLERPQALALAAGDQTLTLSWQAPATLLDGSPATMPLTFQVYRSTNGRDFHRLGEPVAAPVFRDVTVLNGARDYYRVRAIRTYRDTALEGVTSEVVAGVPKDLTPPAPPRDLVAVRAGAGVKLVWEKGAAADLAGYRIFRRAEGETASRFLGQASGTASQFVDLDAPAGPGTWYYSVTAFDSASPPNESGPSLEAAIEIVK